MPTLIFDCDGVLADTEQFGHLPAFNQLFEEEGLPLHWSVDEYAERVKVGGGKERLKSALTPEVLIKAGLPGDGPELSRIVARWHNRKSAIYAGLVSSGVMPGRPGIKRIAQEAHDQGWGLAVASTSAESSVRAVLLHVVGEELARGFSVYAGDVVPAKKPAPDIYLHALKDMGVEASEAVVVEDSQNGLEAAIAAGLPTVVTVSSFTGDEDFSGAALVVSNLGDPNEGTPAEVLANPLSLEIHGGVGLEHLDQLRGGSA